MKKFFLSLFLIFCLPLVLHAETFKARLTQPSNWISSELENQATSGEWTVSVDRAKNRLTLSPSQGSPIVFQIQPPADSRPAPVAASPVPVTPETLPPEIALHPPIETTYVLKGSEENSFSIVKVYEKLGTALSVGDVLAEAKAPGKNQIQVYRYSVVSIQPNQVEIAYEVGAIGDPKEKKMLNIHFEGAWPKQSPLTLHFPFLSADELVKLVLTEENQLFLTK